MEKNKHRKRLAIILSVLFLLSLLSGCKAGKKFSSPEAMIAEMTGTYSGSEGHSEERIVIDGNNIIMFKLDNLFPEITDNDFFWENFSDENWESFDINTLLGKAYVKITTQPVTADIKSATLSGFWVSRNGTLFSSKEGYPFDKTSSDSAYPTAEMREKCEEYVKYLKEYEKAAIVAAAEANLKKEREGLEALLTEATASTSGKSFATAETIANCAFESLMDHIKYPRTATLEGYTRTPQYDSYGRVATLITITTQNAFGNYITEDIYVVLQSCSYAGQYTYKEGLHYCKKGDTLNFLLGVNDWDEDSSVDSKKDPSYKEAIQLIKDKKYAEAIAKLNTIGDYKSAAKLRVACVSVPAAEKYKQAIDLFAEDKYAEAKEALSAFLKSHNPVYLNGPRAIALCDAAIRGASGDNENATEPLATEPLATEPLATEPSVTEPSVTEPSVTEPSVTEPSVTEPSVTAPSATAPSATAPSATAPSGTEPSVTEPSATEPPATEPFATEPPATQPPATQPPTVCSHNYTDATCTEPQTCTLCGKINGSALGHTYNAATCTDPETCSRCSATAGSAAGHKWQDITQTVHHEEQGHYEDVQESKKVQKIKCYACSHKADTVEEYYSHFDNVHGNNSHYLLVRDRYETVQDWDYETVTKWIVDQEAYTQTVVIGRNCSICGKEE